MPSFKIVIEPQIVVDGYGRDIPIASPAFTWTVQKEWRDGSADYAPICGQGVASTYDLAVIQAEKFADNYAKALKASKVFGKLSYSYYVGDE